MRSGLLPLVKASERQRAPRAKNPRTISPEWLDGPLDRSLCFDAHDAMRVQGEAPHLHVPASLSVRLLGFLRFLPPHFRVLFCLLRVRQAGALRGKHRLGKTIHRTKKLS